MSPRPYDADAGLSVEGGGGIRQGESRSQNSEEGTRRLSHLRMRPGPRTNMRSLESSRIADRDQGFGIERVRARDIHEIVARGYTGGYLDVHLIQPDISGGKSGVSHRRRCAADVRRNRI